MNGIDEKINELNKAIIVNEGYIETNKSLIAEAKRQIRKLEKIKGELAEICL